MRKLLSFVIVAMMIVSSIVPVFAYSDAADVPAPQAADAISVWAADTEFNVDTDGEYVMVTINVANNTNGFEYLQTYIIYPECLSIENSTDMEAATAADYGGICEAADLQASSEKTVADVEEKFERALMTDFGYDIGTVGSRTPEQQATYDARLAELLPTGYKYTSPLFDFKRTTKITPAGGGRPVTVDDDMRDNGTILVIWFKYDATKNPLNRDLTIKVMVDPLEGVLHVRRDGYEFSNEWATAETFDGVIDVKPEKDDPCANGHTWDAGVETTPPTCTEAGVKTYTCSVCSETTTEPIAALGHDFVAGTVVPPSCTTAGYTVYECSRCDATENRDEVPATGHTAGASNLTVAPTASSEGQIDSVCANCGEPMDAEVLPAIVSPVIAIEDRTVPKNAAVTVPVVLTNGNYGIDDIAFTATWDKALGADVAITLAEGVYTADDEVAPISRGSGRCR